MTVDAWGSNGAMMAVVNAEIDRIHESFGLANSEFFCECGRIACGERITLSRRDYALLLDQSRRVIAPTHGDDELAGTAEMSELGGRFSLSDVRLG